MRFQAIYADTPWAYQVYYKKGQGRRGNEIDGLDIRDAIQKIKETEDCDEAR